MSPKLTPFYTAMQQWIDAGCPYPHNPHNFSTAVGLCHNLKLWVDSCGLWEDVRIYSNALTVEFDAHDLNPNYPFSTSDSYDDEASDGTLYKNPARLAWIKERASA